MSLWTERAIAGALRNTIDAHGPITHQWSGSAAKRIMRLLTTGEGPTHDETNADIADETTRQEVVRLRQENQQFRREVAWLMDMAFPVEVE